MEQHRQKIEQYGVMMEKMGLSPVAARVFIYLLLSPDHGATFEDLVDYFKVSKSAVSGALKMLTNTNMADSKTVGGQRKRYFNVTFNFMLDESLITSKFKMMYFMLDDIRVSRGIKDDFSQRLEDISMLYKMLLAEVPIIVERWKKMISLNNKLE